MNQDLIDQIQQARAITREAKKKYYLTHFYEFSRDILGWPDIYEPLHREVCEFVQYKVKKKNLLILLPRGSFKSSLVTIGYPLWRLANDQRERILIANATYPMATSFLSQIKDHISKNEVFKELFGDFSANADSWREDKISISREKSYEQKEPSVIAQGISTNVTGSHYSLAILDDMVNRENITTRDQMDKVINFYKDALDLIDVNKQGHKEIVVIGTSWHYADLYSWIQDKETGIIGDFEVLKRPAYTGEWRKGKLLFPDRLSWEVLDSLKRSQGSSHFSSQYMLDPKLLEDAIFKFKFKSYEETDIRGLSLNKFITVDPAISEKKEADYSAMICVGVDKQNNWYILDIWRDKVPPKRLLDQMFYWDEKWKPIKVGIETTAFQKALQYFAYDEMKRKNHFMPIVELKHEDRSKFDRIMGLEPRYETGSVFHPQKTSVPLVEELEKELRDFDKGKHDDLCFIAGTKILTNKGQVNIEDIKKGDFVFTRKGFKEVLVSSQTGMKKVVTRFGLTGTSNHPIFTKNGIKRLDKVNVSDILYIWNGKQLSIVEKSITDILNQKEDNLEFIFGGMINGKLRHFLYTVKYGLITLGRYLKDMLFIIKIKIALITKYLIYNVFRLENMRVWVGLRKGVNGLKRTLRLPEKQRKNGIGVRKEESGIKNIQKMFGKKLKELLKDVYFVIRNIKHLLKIQCIVQINVGKNIGKQKVYNLQVKDENEYFANNILVHNCDALASQLELAFPVRYKGERSLKTKRSVYPA